MIPFLDLQKINRRFEADFQEKFQVFLNTGYYILGENVTAFEKEFADYCGTLHCVGVGNGLDALRLILEGYKLLKELKPGDEVLVSSNTFIATILAIKQSGLTPVLVEAEGTTYNFDMNTVEASISARTRAIMPVHLYGQLAPMTAINALAAKHDLLVIEDAAQAHGCKNSSGKLAGNLGDVAAFSFYPAKNLGALGDGGAVTTNNTKLANAIRQLGNYGTSSKYVNEVLGFNSRLDEIQALFLRCKLPTLDVDNARRRDIADRYLSEIKNEKIKLPQYSFRESHVFHLFVVQVEDRSHFMKYLTENGVGSLIHYPIAPHQQKALKEFETLRFPVTESLHERVVSIPMSPVLSNDEIHTIIDVLNGY